MTAPDTTERLFSTDCGEIIRRANDHGTIFLQRCVLVIGHAGPCSPSRWQTVDSTAVQRDDAA